ncbi:MAG: ATPase, T2SS/T4P/T4SS family [Clostridia bacterium]|nr:ATPase, T2SS/T4P/T4SS family [Clostridia bacterium]
MQGIKDNRIEDLFYEAGLINELQMKKLQDLNGDIDKIEALLIDDGLSNYKGMLESLAQRMGVDFVDLDNTKVNKAAVSKLTSDIAKSYFVFPFEYKDNYLYLAMKNPDDIFVIDEIKVFAQTEIKPFLADSRLIEKALKYFYKIDFQAGYAQDSKPSLAAGEAKGSRPLARRYSRDGGEDTNASDTESFIRAVLLKALRLGASDIHADTADNMLRIRYRVDGMLISEEKAYLFNPESFLTRIKVMAGIFTCEKNIPQKGLIEYDINKKEKIRVGVHTLPTVDGEKLLLRLENINSSYTIDEIGLTDYEKNSIDTMLRRKAGMIIVSGLRASGRTTTAYALIKKILSNDVNIMTVEKKVLEKIQGVNQVYYQEKQDESALSLVKSVVEHDPDILMVDVDTDCNLIKYLMSIALGGKLVIVTMSFPGTCDVVTGLINMGIEPYLAAAAIEGIISQYLVRKLCTRCKNKLAAQQQEKNSCDVCSNTGYKGKTGVFEVFNINREYRKLIAKPDNLNIIESKIESEKSTFEKNCIRLVNDEITSIEEVVRVGLGKGLFEN